MNRVLLNLLLVVSGAIATACQQASTPTANQLTPTTAPSNVSTNQETPPATSFNAEIYLLANPDVAKQIKAGKYKSALEHYEKVGKSAKNAQGEAIEGFFTDTPGNDTIKGFGPKAVPIMPVFKTSRRVKTLLN
ncbi:MAG: hypothetical protein KME45_13945 [Stenomitos rutilans HA7619-LM2]|nr:hypothetical protein [Stenomitos rutilans HA7619-LM2]